MANPNNCESCDHYRRGHGSVMSWCYMFEDEPKELCGQHTGRYEREKGCPEKGCNLNAPCPDCGPTLIG